jgi:hypothetical protein
MLSSYEIFWYTPTEPGATDQGPTNQARSDQARKNSDEASKVTQDGKEFCLQNFFTFSRIFSLCGARFFIFFTGDRYLIIWKELSLNVGLEPGL